MAFIVLANFDGLSGARLGTQLAESLRQRDHRVEVVRIANSITSVMQGITCDPDILYLYVRTPSTNTEGYLDQLWKHWIDDGPRPLVLCILENFFGARFHLSLEMKGARVTYLQRLEENTSANHVSSICHGRLG